MIPWRWGRFLGLTVAGLAPTASQLTKIGKIVSHIELPVKLLDYFLRCNKSNINQPAGCRLCSRARESWFESTNDLADETYATLAMQVEKGLHLFTELPTTSSERTCMTACRLHKNQKSSSSLSRLTKKVNWQESAAKKRICSKEHVVAVTKAQKIEVTIGVKKIIFENWPWGRWPDSVAINEDIQIAYAFTGKRSTNRDEGLLEKEKEANE